MISGRDVRTFEVGNRPVGATRPFVSSARPASSSRVTRPSVVPPHRSYDVRYSRPTVWHLRRPAYAHHHPPHVWTYRPYYTRWYCHPWYRHRYSTYAVVSFGFTIYPWYAWWVPPARPGWTWVPGYWAYGYWHPGHWVPVYTAPVGYVYVPGWWEDEVYVEGYYRVEERKDWEWVEGYYLDDGTYVRGHWVPTGPPPDGYTWEPGFWDGEQYVDGFWRPEYRAGFVWVDSYYDEDGIYHSGYWMPQDERPGQVWIPGWFDGNEWIQGYWVDEAEVTEEALESWEPPEGVDDGWDEPVVDPQGQAPPARIIEKYREETGEMPLALPVPAPE